MKIIKIALTFLLIILMFVLSTGSVVPYGLNSEEPEAEQSFEEEILEEEAEAADNSEEEPKKEVFYLEDITDEFGNIDWSYYENLFKAIGEACEMLGQTQEYYEAIIENFKIHIKGHGILSGRIWLDDDLVLHGMEGGCFLQNNYPRDDENHDWVHLVHSNYIEGEYADVYTFREANELGIPQQVAHSIPKYLKRN